ncbi:MAG: MBL fold metallo-hydrolase [Syntrophobacteraceae bacterium]
MSEVTVRFLGTGDAFGSGGRFQTCICVESEESRFLIDFGASSLIAMKCQGVNTSDIDAIFLSHLHGDHFGGLPFLFLHEQLVSKRTRPITIAGPPGLEKRVYEAMEAFFPGSSRIKRRFAVDFVELAERTPIEIGKVRATSFPVVHPSGSPSLALRIECGGKVIAYSGDTEWTDALVAAAAGADLFVSEAYYFSKSMKFHLDYRTLMDHRAELRCERLMLTHASEDLLGRLGELEAECAQDGQWFIV